MSEINFEALEDRVVIKIVEEEKTTISGIILSKDIKNNTIQGTVVKTGPGKPLENGDTRPMSVHEGDTVLIMKNTGINLTLNEDNVVIVRESEILGIIE